MSVWLETAAVYSDKSFVLTKHFDDLACGYGLNENENCQLPTANCQLPTANSLLLPHWASGSYNPAMESTHVSPRVLIVGAGWIGRQVGLRMAICGLRVELLDKNQAVLDDARQWMEESSELYLTSILSSPTLPKLAPETASAWRERVGLGNSVESLRDDTAVVLECVSETLGLKRRVLREFSAQFSKNTIIASNSSYFTPSTLAEFVTLPERFAHWHFHVPLHRSSIADVVGHPATEPWVLERLIELTQIMDHYPLRLRREQPGYVFNWLLQSVLRSALELAARDVADIEDIDRAWKTVSGMPLGPFAMMDHIGLDVIEQVLANARWAQAESVPIDQLLTILRGPIGQGHLGVKTGRGFYEHE